MHPYIEESYEEDVIKTDNEEYYELDDEVQAMQVKIREYEHGNYSSEEESEIESNKEGSFISSDELENGALGWDQILFLPYNIVWIIFLQVLVVFQSAAILSIIGLNVLRRLKNTDVFIFITIFINIIDIVYLLNFVLECIYKNWTRINTTKSFRPKSTLALSLDVLSLIPLEQFYRSVASRINVRILPYLLTNRLLRLHYFYTFFVPAGSRCDYQYILLRLLELASYIVIVSHLMMALLHSQNSNCDVLQKTDCEDTFIAYFIGPELGKENGSRDVHADGLFDWYCVTLYVQLTQVINRGFPEIPKKTPAEYGIFIIAIAFSIIVVIGVTIAPLIVTIILHKQTFFIYSHLFRILTGILKEEKISSSLMQKVHNYFDVCWKKWKGVKSLTFFHYIPDVTKREVCVDIHWNAYKHSQLFREANMGFLRNISIYFTPEFYLAGDIICKKHDMKMKMIYVVSGVLQVLSEEDDETPVISFSSGTCIGESTLFLSFRSKTILRCATYCELHVLYRDRLSKIIREFPYHQKVYFKSIMDRYKKAKDLEHISAFIKQESSNYIYLETTVSWLKETIYNILTLRNSKISKTTGSINNFSNEEMSSVYDEVQFTAKFMDLYVLTEKLEHMTHAVCLSGNFPWILQPGSPFLLVWERILIACIVTMTIIIPYNYSFDPNNTLFIIISILTSVYIFDIYLQLSTAIQTKQGLVTNFKKIIYWRFLELSFIVDFLASIPIEFSVYLLETHGNTFQMKCLFQLNRLLRIWKIEVYFKKIENSFYIRMDALHLMKFTLYTLLLVYMFGAFLYNRSCSSILDCDLTGWVAYSKEGSFFFLTPIPDVYAAMYYSSQIISGVNYDNISPMNMADIRSVILGMILSAMLYIYMVCSLSSIFILIVKRRYIYQEKIKNVGKFMKDNKLDKGIQERVYKFLRIEWQYSKGISMETGDLLSNLPTYLKDDIQIATLARILASVPLFESFSREFIMQLATVVKVQLLPENEIVTYAGSVASEMYIIKDGICEVVSRINELEHKIIGPNSYFADVEMCLDIPVVHTVRTITNCKIITLSSDKFQHIFSLFPNSFQEFKELIESMQDLKEMANIYDEHEAQHNTKLTELKGTVKSKSFYHFEFHLHYNTPEGKDYYEPFQKLRRFKFVRYLLLHTTILPDGKFIKWWEIVRACCAFLSSIVFPYYPALAVNIPWSVYLMHSLDVCALIDLYVRMHVCYYNSSGILVRHPLRTFQYYMKHAFVTDLLACCPFELFFSTDGSGEHQEYKLKRYFVLNRVLQAYRIVLGALYIQEDIVHPKPLFSIFKYLPFVLILMNIISSIIIKMTCSFDKDLTENNTFSEGVICNIPSWITASDYASYHQLSAGGIYIISLYWTVATITRTGLQGIYFQSKPEALLITVLSIIGILFTTTIISITVALRSSQNNDRTIYQQQMRTLIDFLNDKSISSDLKENTIDYFEILWKCRRGTDAHVIFSGFHTSLKEDVLYAMYGLSFKHRSVFSMASKTFFQSLMVHARCKIFIRKTNILTINDINSNFYIIHKGRVEVRGPDGNQLALLHPGALFGNIDNIPTVRQQVTIIAHDQVEVLEIKTAEFYSILSNYPLAKKRFEEVTRVHMDYVASIPKNEQLILSEAYKQFLADEEEAINLSNISFQHKVYFPSSLPYRIWEISALIIGSYINFVIIVYQFSLEEYHPVLFVIGYIFDLSYAIKPFIKLNLAYEGKFGEMVTNRNAIRHRYIHSLLGLRFDIFTLLPVEVFAFISKKSTMFYFTLLRFNRLPRAYLEQRLYFNPRMINNRICPILAGKSVPENGKYSVIAPILGILTYCVEELFVVEYFETRNNKLNVNLIFTKFGFLIAWITLLIHVLSCILITIVCYNDECEESKTNSINKFRLYWRNFLYIESIFTCTSFASTIKKTNGLVIYFTVVAIICLYAISFFIAETYAALEVVKSLMTTYTVEIVTFVEVLKRHNLSPVLVDEVWAYLCNLWQVRRGRQVPLMLEDCPYYMKENIYMALYGKHIQENFIFSKSHKDMLRQIVSTLEPLTFFPGNIIIFDGDVDNSMYYIHVGEVEALKEGVYVDTVIETLKEGDVFGLVQGLHPRTAHEYTYRAHVFTVVLKLERLKWEYLLTYFPASKREIDRQTNLLNKE